MDHSLGITSATVKWSVYQFTGFTPTAIAMMSVNDGNDYDYWLRLGAFGAIYKMRMNKGDLTDPGGAFTWIFQTYPSFFDEGAVNQFVYFRLRIKYSGTLNLDIGGEDNALQLASFSSTYSSVGRDLGRPVNFVNEKMWLSISSNTAGTIQRIDIFGKVKWSSRPSV